MKRPGYREAIRWIAENDDNEWLTDENGLPSVTASMVADLFDVPLPEVAKALARQLEIKPKDVLCNLGD